MQAEHLLFIIKGIDLRNRSKEGKYFKGNISENTYMGTNVNKLNEIHINIYIESD